MYNPFTLDRKTILVTGASSGIGKAVAIECSKMGATVIITGRNEERLDDTFSQLEGDGHCAVIADLTTAEGIEKILQQSDQISGAVFCAGVIMVRPFHFCDIDNVRSLMDVNFFSPVHICQQLVKKKKVHRDGGSLVFISSVSGTLVSVPASSIYSASKGALNGLVKGMALDMASKKIRVNAVSPGMVETSIAVKAEEIVSSESIESDRKKYPLGRYGKPEEVAHGVIYLLSDASQWITGTNLVIDGGFTSL